MRIDETDAQDCLSFSIATFADNYDFDIALAALLGAVMGRIKVEKGIAKSSDQIAFIQQYLMQKRVDLIN